MERRPERASRTLRVCREEAWYRRILARMTGWDDLGCLRHMIKPSAHGLISLIRKTLMRHVTPAGSLCNGEPALLQRLIQVRGER